MYKEVGIALLISFLMLVQPVSGESGEKIDVVHYDLDIQLFPDEHKFDVSAVVEILATEDGVTDIEFSFNEDLQIGAIWGEGNALAYERRENNLIVLFDYPLRENEEILLIFEYAGVAGKEPELGESIWGYIGNDGSYMIYESSWYPIIWGDRATAMISLRVPAGQTGIALGDLVLTTSDGKCTEFVYAVDTPTGGISFAAGEYATKATFFGHIPVTIYAYPEDIWGTELALIKANDILRFYSETFSEYPYESLKIVEIPEYFMGGHGDQGMIMLYSTVFKKESDTGFLAHEIAHNWWGAHVSAVGEQSLRSSEGFGIFSKSRNRELQESKDHNLWIIEGFATYSSMMYAEHTGGKGAMIDYLATAREEYLGNIETKQDEPIISAKEEYGRTGVYHAVVYSKGALVLHMLRYVVGDETFFSIMDTFAKNYGGKSATVRDFKEVAEDVSGRNLGWFFDEWVHDTTLPDYALGDVSVTKTSGYEVNFKIYQTGDLAKMPIDVTLHSTKSTATKRIWVDKDAESFTITTSSKPLYIEIDKDQWVLESDRSNNLHVISYPKNVVGVKLLLKELARRLN